MTQDQPGRPIQQREVALPPVDLPGILSLPEGAQGLVVFAHGSGSSRLSPRNTCVAEALQHAGFATLLFDLLLETEAADRDNVFDIPLLADRLTQAASQMATDPDTAALPLGYFGASTGAAAALVAAASPGSRARAIVSRGGRPDLAGEALPRIAAPTLLIVGGRDAEVLDMNERALAQLACEKALRVVPGATHLFEEPGALDTVIEHTRDWFTQHP